MGLGRLGQQTDQPQNENPSAHTANLQTTAINKLLIGARSQRAIVKRAIMVDMVKVISLPALVRFSSALILTCGQNHGRQTTQPPSCSAVGDNKRDAEYLAGVACGGLAGC